MGFYFTIEIVIFFQYIEGKEKKEFPHRKIGKILLFFFTNNQLEGATTAEHLL